MKRAWMVVLVIACGGQQKASGPSPTCQDAADHVAEMFRTHSGISADPRFDELAGAAANTTSERCKADNWSRSAILCVSNNSPVDGPFPCIQSGFGIDDTDMTCPLMGGTDGGPPGYGPHCTGITKAQADSYRTAMMAAIKCDPTKKGQTKKANGSFVTSPFNCVADEAPAADAPPTN